MHARGQGTPAPHTLESIVQWAFPAAISECLSGAFSPVILVNFRGCDGMSQRKHGQRVPVVVAENHNRSADQLMMEKLLRHAGGPEISCRDCHSIPIQFKGNA